MHTYILKCAFVSISLTKAWGWQQTKGWEEGPSCSSRLLERLAMPCSSTVAHYGLLVFLNWGLSWLPGRLPNLWQLQMCNCLPPLPRTAFSSPTDLPRDGKTLNVLLTPAFARVHLNRDFCSSVWVWWNGLRDISFWHFTETEMTDLLSTSDLLRLQQANPKMSCWVS